MKRFWWVFLIIGVIVIFGAVTVIGIKAKATAPVRTTFNFPWAMLADEAEVMNDCVSCHEPVKFHTCSTCHDEHGAVEMADVPFDDLILLQGDVPEPGYIPVNDILPYRTQPNTHVELKDFLSNQGVTEFSSVTLASRDEGWITITSENLTDKAMLLPHMDGVRFAAEDLHVSTWLKGVWRIVVVGVDKPLRLDGYRTSIGRLMLGPTSIVTIEQADVMLRDSDDNQVRKAKTASRIEGAALTDIVADPDFDVLKVYDAEGNEHTLSQADAHGAVLVQMGKQIVLVLPSRGRSQWITGVVELVSEE